MTNCSASRRHGAGLDRAVGPDARRKGADTFPPVGPWLVTADEIPDPQDLDLFLDLNGTRRQTGNTRTMIFDVAWLVSHISRRTTLLPGGIVTTGTPSGVGMRMTPPLYLVPGDVMRLGIAGLGEQRQEVSRVTDTPRPVPPR